MTSTVRISTTEWARIEQNIFEGDLERGDATCALILTAIAHDEGRMTYNETMHRLGRIAANIGPASLWGATTAFGDHSTWNQSVLARKLFELAEQLATSAITVDDGVGVLFDLTR